MSNEPTESDDALILRVAREEIKRQAAEIERLQHWKRAVDDACTVSWVAVTDDARETVKALIARECQIALDPLVSSDAQALIDRGRKEAEAEIERLKTRLEVSPEHPYDGIASRDATIKLQDERIAELEQDAARYRYIRTHRIDIKWCELYAGGPALDGVIDKMMTEAGPSPINSAALRAAEQATAEGRTESVIAIYRAIREAQIDLPPPSSAPSSGLDSP